VKWSPPDGVIDVRVTAADEARLTVADQGSGIPEADLPHVFDRFYRSPTARAMPGSGLGLSIVRQIARAHGGDVTACRRDRGALLVLALPRLPSPE
jgi:two-component system sensor histidine kinase MprB